MLNAITHSHIWVLDQDQALDFYVEKLGLEVRADVDLEVMRWLTVGVPGQPDREILLEMPGSPGVDPDSAAQIRDLVAKGATGLSAIFTTENAQATYEDLRDKGVEITQEPVERFYGIDMGIRDPFGNHLRITQPAPMPAGGWPSEVKIAEF
jgi:catechol 2,3-dioxygenase-like lactoylglutathione lyase family enzyme